MIKKRNIVICGLRHPNEAESTRLLNQLQKIKVQYGPENVLIITGACIGIDTEAAMIARHLQMRVKYVIPSDRKQVDPHWKDNCDEYEEMPFDTSFMQRNERMVEIADELFAFAAFPEDASRSTRSGTWATVRRARKKGIKVTTHTLRYPDEAQNKEK